MLPTLRKRLKTISDGNKGLQDILRSMQEGTEILSVEPYNSKVHNTKITLLLKSGEKRVHFYNRLSLKKILEAYPAVVGNTIDEVIENLNLLGCDFTLDDIDLVSDSIVAKPTSLGYYNVASESTNNNQCIPTSLNMERFNDSLPEALQNGALTVQVTKNGNTTTQVVRPSQLGNIEVALTVANMIVWFAESQGITFAGGGGGFAQYQVYDRSISGGSTNSNPGVVEGPILLSPDGLTPPGPSVPNPTSIRIMKTQGEPVETDIFEWLLAAESELDAETLAEARSLGLSVRSCGTQYWEGL